MEGLDPPSSDAAATASSARTEQGPAAHVRLRLSGAPPLAVTATPETKKQNKREREAAVTFVDAEQKMGCLAHL